MSQLQGIGGLSWAWNGMKAQGRSIIYQVTIIAVAVGIYVWGSFKLFQFLDTIF